MFLALATVSYIQFGLGSSNWNGNWSPFFSNQFSKFINEGMPLAINSYINLTDLSKNLEALQDAVSLGSTYKIKVDFVAIFPSFDRFDKELVDEAQTELDLEPPTIDERVKDLIEQEVSKTEIKKQEALEGQKSKLIDPLPLPVTMGTDATASIVPKQEQKKDFSSHTKPTLYT